MFVASCYNHDDTYWTDWAGVVWIIGGAIYFAVMASDKPDDLDYEHQFLEASFLVYVSVELLVIAGLLSTIVGSWCYNFRKETTHSLQVL